MKKKLAVLAAAAVAAGILLGVRWFQERRRKKQLFRLETGKRCEDHRRL